MLSIPSDIENAIHNASVQTGVNEQLLQAFAYVESNFTIGSESGTGVRGLYQITGDTWTNIRKKHQQTLGYTLDVNEQALTAAYLIQDLQKIYGDDRDLIAIAYNAGEGVANYVKRNGKTNQSIANAVQIQRSKGGNAAKGFGPGKEKEVSDYPVKLAKVLDEPVTITGATCDTSNKNQSVSNGDKPQSYEYKKDQPFVINLFAANSEKTSDMSKLDQKTVNQSQLVSWINAGLRT